MATSIHECYDNQFAHGAIHCRLWSWRVWVSSRRTDVAKRWNTFINDGGQGDGWWRHDIRSFQYIDAKDTSNDPANITRQLALDLCQYEKVWSAQHLFRMSHDAADCWMPSQFDERSRSAQICLGELHRLLVLSAENTQCTFLQKYIHIALKPKSLVMLYTKRSCTW